MAAAKHFIQFWLESGAEGGVAVRLTDGRLIEGRPASVDWMGNILFDSGGTETFVTECGEVQTRSVHQAFAPWDKIRSVSIPEKVYHRVTEEVAAVGINNQNRVTTANGGEAAAAVAPTCQITD